MFSILLWSGSGFNLKPIIPARSKALSASSGVDFIAKALRRAVASTAVAASIFSPQVSSAAGVS